MARIDDFIDPTTGQPMFTPPDPNAIDFGGATQRDAPQTWWDQFDPEKRFGGNTGVTGGFPSAGGFADNPNQPPAPVIPGNILPTPPIQGQPGAPAVQANSANNAEAFRAAWFASGGKTVEDLRAFVAAHPEYGAQITGSKGSKLIINGQAFQAVRSAGMGGGIGPAWDDLGPEGGGGPGAQAGGAPGFGAYTTPWNTPFQARDPNQIASDPAFQFQMKEGMNAIQHGAAARGTLLTGGTLKALDRFGQGLASTYDDKFYNRDWNEYGLKYGIFKDNQDRPFDKNYRLADLGRPH